MVCSAPHGDRSAESARATTTRSASSDEKRDPVGNHGDGRVPVERDPTGEARAVEGASSATRSSAGARQSSSVSRSCTGISELCRGSASSLAHHSVGGSFRRSEPLSVLMAVGLRSRARPHRRRVLCEK